MGLQADTHGRPRDHAGVLQRPACRSRHSRIAQNPGQVTNRLARPPESHRRIHKLTSASLSSTTRKEETMTTTDTSAMRPLLFVITHDVERLATFWEQVTGLPPTRPVPVF